MAHETILLVEDEPSVRQTVDEMLTRHGYRVISAASADDAMRVFSDGAAIDLLVTDVVMPHRDGVALANDAKRLRPGLRVLYISGHDDPSRLRTDRRHGRLLRKPFRSGDLAAAVRAALVT
jgi:DNA-binding NtrC family response regulator